MPKPPTTAATTATTVTLPQTLLDQADALATHLHISREQLITHALESYIATHAAPTGVSPTLTQRVINQGEIYWVQLSGQTTTTVPHPYVVIQDNLFNHSRLDTVIVCALTSNRRRISETPGNVLLDAGEANLPKPSVVEVSKISTVTKAQLGNHIGTLTPTRVQEILNGLRFLQRATTRR